MFRRAVIFIFQLDADDRAAVLPKQAVQLAADFAVENRNRFQIAFVIGTEVPSFLQQPVRQTAVADFAVTPRAAAHDDFQSRVAGGLNKTAQIALARPVELTFNFFVMNPKNVGGHDVHAAGLHLEQFFAPLIFGAARVVKLAHHRRPRTAIKKQAVSVKRERGSIGRGCRAHVERFGWCGGGIGHGNGELIGESNGRQQRGE